MRKAVSIAALVLTAAFALGQMPPGPDPAAQAQQIKRLDFMVGDWQGEGWMDLPGGRRETFTSSEKVQYKLDGTALLIEGLHKSKASGQVVHNALAVVTYDEQAKNFRFKSALASGRAGDYTGTVTGENTFVWGMDAGRGKIRYTIKLNDKGQWFEVGEFSPDGETWRKFFEMTLSKGKA